MYVIYLHGLFVHETAIPEFSKGSQDGIGSELSRNGYVLYMKLV